MSKILAIRGHSSRGKEVIELLEMMGGSNIHNLSGNDIYSYYIIKGFKNEIREELYIFGNENIYYFTLEEFLEKYPFKIGDKVIDNADGCPGVVCEMKWDEDVSDMKYCVAFGNGIDFGWFANDSINYFKIKKDENLEETPVRDKDDILFDSIIWHLRNSVNNGKQYLSGGDCEAYFRELVKNVKENDMKSCKSTEFEDIKNENFEEKKFPSFEPMFKMNDEIEYKIPDGYEINEVLKGTVIIKPIKSQYPTTYKDCCDVLHIVPLYNLRYHTYEHGYHEYATSNELLSLQDKLNTLGKLLICRKAYWKIAGEEMGLYKPWEPDWDNLSTNHEFIKINKGYFTYSSRLLVFPTEKMRDEFYENFKELIEACKEFI